MSGVNEDVPPLETYPYFWSPRSELPINEFVAKYRPSMVQNDGTKPWLWVQSSKAHVLEHEDRRAALDEATNLRLIENVKSDESIPVRSNKKTGIKNKKEVREQLQAEAGDKLRDIATSHRYFTGKWLIFASPDKVDSIWEALAKSLVSGPLSSSTAWLAKVSTSPAIEVAHYQHVICLYLPNVYDKDDVSAVMKILIRNHGLHLNGVKSDLYTLIGLDSKHPSGIPSTIWKTTALMTDGEMKKLRDAFFSEAQTGKCNMATEGVKGGKQPDETDKKVKSKPKLKKVDEDPFASDDDQA